MKTLLKIILIVLILNFIGCDLNNNKTPKLIEIGNVTELERIIKNHTNIAELNPKNGLKSIIEFYEKSDSMTVDSNENPIPIYVTYGVDYWKMDQKTFEITFANQRINQIDGKLYEYRIDLIYEPKEFIDEKEFLSKYNPGIDITKFKKEVMNSNGFKKAMKNKPKKNYSNKRTNLKMGYELNIQREDENNKIRKEEWIEYMESDSEFNRIEEFSADLGNNELLTVPTPNGGLWKSDKGEVPFTFSDKYGEITVKNPEHWVIEKMISISKNLNAIVIGEEGENYDEEYLKDPFANPFESENSNNEKKWWQFWK